MDYIKVINFRLQVVKNHGVDEYDLPFITYINQLLRPSLTTLMAQTKIIKYQYGFKHKIPIVINDNCVLICLKSYRSYHAFYINFVNILSWRQHKKAVIISFMNGHELRFKSYHIFKQQVSKIRKLLAIQKKI